MSREKYMRRRVMEALYSLHPIAVENPIYPGTPDINHVHGWLELKHLDEWPKRPDTVVRVTTWSTEQKLWFRQRHAAGGLVQLLLRVGDEWMLFGADTAVAAIGCLPRAGLVAVALQRWPRGLAAQELCLACSIPRT